VRRTGWIGVDLDGTVAHYATDDFHKYGPYHIGEPVPAMVERVKKWLAAGYEVRIFTARVSDDDLATHQRIESWARQHIGRTLEATCKKDYQMMALYDDRAWRVEENTGRVIGEDGDEW